MDRPRLFAEFPAGLAAVSLRLQGGAHCRPPISRMGNKAGYAQTILAALGLHSGQGAMAYWWAEADPDVAALLRIYPDPDALREVARIIRGWAGEEPRALWERLRAERRARGAVSGTAGEVAGWMVSADWAYRQGNPDSGFNPSVASGVAYNAGCDTFADRADRLANSAISAPVRVSPRIPSAAEVAATIGTPGDLEGCIVYIDGPYENTTGYGHELPRSEQVRIALDFAGAGATVALSEAEPIPALTGLGWYATEITGGRVGQRRTFSRQQQEIITMNKPPQYTVPTQSSLFP